MAREADHYEDSTLHAQRAPAQQTPTPGLHWTHQAAGELDHRHLERARARLHHALAAGAAAAQTLGAPAAAGADRRRLGGGADPYDRCDCLRCCARRLAELGARVQDQLDALTPSQPPAPAPADTDPDAQLLEPPAAGAR